MPYCMNAASGARGRRANGTASAILTRLPPNCGEKKCFLPWVKTTEVRAGMRNHTGQRPNVAQRRLKTAAKGMADIYRKRTGQFDVTELQQNIIHFVQSHVPGHSGFPFALQA